MKKTVITFGLISGAVSSLLMLGTVPFIHDSIGFDTAGYVVGYTSIVLSFMLVFFGIRSYRDNVAGGQVSFGKAFQVGILITLISCVFYVVTWEGLYFTVMHDFTDKYAAYVIKKEKASGASDAAILAKTAELKKFKEMYENPFINVAMTLAEPFPVGLIITVISAAVLRRKAGVQSGVAQTAVS